MDTLSIENLNVNKNIKGNLLFSGIFTLEDFMNADLNRLKTELTPDQIESLKDGAK